MEEEISTEKTRHGCLTAYLGFMILVNSAMALVYILAGGSIASAGDLPGWALPVLGLFGVVNVACAVGLFMWKKWGFFGFCASAGIVFVINILIGLPMSNSIMGLVGIGVLYGVLQIGGEKKGWNQLE